MIKNSINRTRLMLFLLNIISILTWINDKAVLSSASLV